MYVSCKISWLDVILFKDASPEEIKMVPLKIEDVGERAGLSPIQG